MSYAKSLGLEEVVLSSETMNLIRFGGGICTVHLAGGPKRLKGACWEVIVIHFTS